MCFNETNEVPFVYLTVASPIKRPDKVRWQLQTTVLTILSPVASFVRNANRAYRSTTTSLSIDLPCPTRGPQLSGTSHRRARDRDNEVITTTGVFSKYQSRSVSTGCRIVFLSPHFGVAVFEKKCNILHDRLRGLLPAARASGIMLDAHLNEWRFDIG
jgi:hypothetical protein